jgi:hypothetical protein
VFERPWKEVPWIGFLYISLDLFCFPLQHTFPLFPSSHSVHTDIGSYNLIVGSLQTKRFGLVAIGQSELEWNETIARKWEDLRIISPLSMEILPVAIIGY